MQQLPSVYSDEGVVNPHVDVVSSGTRYFMDTSGNNKEQDMQESQKILVESSNLANSSKKFFDLPSQPFNSFRKVSMPSLPISKEQPKNMNELNVMLANEFTDLSVKEREKALHDIHGVTDLAEEDPAVLVNALVQLDIELDRIINKRAYDMAKAQRPEYVRNRRFLLKFLRAENSNARNAAARIVRSFESKLELFGKDKLTKDITMNDLDPYERELLRSGNVQILPKDLAGRTVLWSMGQIYRDNSTESWLRICWYLLLTAAEDEETQKRGVVMVLYDVGQQSVHQGSSYNRKSALKIPALVTWSVPCPVTAIHVCYSKSAFAPFLALAAMMCEKHSRSRLRIHNSDSHKECHSILKSFGISDLVTPVGLDGELSVGHHLNFLAVRETQEQAREAESLLASTFTNQIVLGPFDVLSGSRGRLVQAHSGNKQYLHLVESFLVRYEEVSKFEKTVFAQTVLRIVKERGGRFLKQGKNAPGGWKEINDDEAHQKISHAFRNRRRGSDLGCKTTVGRRCNPHSSKNPAMSSPRSISEMELSEHVDMWQIVQTLL